MIHAEQPARVALNSAYERWHGHFLRSRDQHPPLPWSDPYHLNLAERSLVTRSIQQFQLGEWANGRGLRQRAASHSCFAADCFFQAALQLFIEEEQRHSLLLARFLDREGIPKLRKDWIDGSFRRLRKMAGLEVCITVLVTAEVLAVPFYQALRDATRSVLLRGICVQVLRDEAHHLNYQAVTLGALQRRASGIARAIRSLSHGALFHGTALVLWRQHRPVFHAAGWSLSRFWREARRVFLSLRRRIAAESARPEPA